VVSKVGIFFLSEVSTFQLRSTEKGISTRVGDVGGRSSSRTSFTMSPAVAARRLEKSLSWSEIPADFLHRLEWRLYAAAFVLCHPTRAADFLSEKVLPQTSE